MDKTKFISMLLMVTLFGQCESVKGQPVDLNIARANGQSVIFWPESSNNYALQSITNLAMSNWMTLRGNVTLNAVAISNADTSGFFRLIQSINPTNMVLIPAGWFTMGDPIDSESDAFPANIFVSAFFMEVDVVNYGLWSSVYSYATNNGYNFINAGRNGGQMINFPVCSVDWFDCIKWCNARSQQAGLTPCYYTDAGFAHVFTNGDVGTQIFQNLSFNGYRLPTEAEWEKAARGGGIGLRFPWGNFVHATQAQYAARTNSTGYEYDLGPTTTPSGPSPVGSFDINGFGLHDMAGNVSEWCWDWYGQFYGQSRETIDPVGSDSGSLRVLRGGNWLNLASLCRCANRYNGDPSAALGTFGFRCARSQ